MKDISSQDKITEENGMEDNDEVITTNDLEKNSAQQIEIANLKNTIQELQDKLLRTQAEMENARRRHDKMLEEAREYAITNFAKDLTLVMDNLSRALEHKPEEVNSEMQNIITGVEMTNQELQAVFNKHGVEVIKPQPGEKFNYNHHHAISQIVTDEYEDGSILTLMQSGYKIKERLLRPATVAVSKKAN